MAALNGGSEMKQIDDPLDAVRSTKTAGEILFAICLVMAITIYLLNSTMSKQRELMSAKSRDRVNRYCVSYPGVRGSLPKSYTNCTYGTE